MAVSFLRDEKGRALHNKEILQIVMSTNRAFLNNNRKYNI